VRVRSWTLAVAKSSGKEIKLTGGAYAKSVTGLKLRNAQLITLAYGPSNKDLPKVNALTEVALLQAIEGTGPVVSTTTTAVTTPTPTTVAPVATTTTAPVATSTTTKPSTTTTTK
jgi:hypothetical protein